MLGNPFVLTASEKEDIRQSLLKLKEKLPKDLGVSYIESRSEKRIRSEISQNPTLCELIDAIGSEFISPKQDIRSLGSSITNCLAAIFTLQKTETVTNLLKYSGIIELIRISYMFEYLAQEVNPDPLFLDDLFNAYTNIVSGTFIGNHINPKLKSLLPIVKRMMDATELMRMTHEKSSLKIDEIQKLIPLLNQQVSTSESNIALIYNENNYTQFANDPSVLSELVQSVDAIAKQEKPRTQFIIFPNHKLLHVTSIDVRWNPQSKRLEFTSIDFTNNPAIKYLALELLARYQNASFYLCMTEYQKDPFGCRLYSLLACKDIYPHFNHQMLESAPVISQPEVTKIGSKKLNALLHTALDEKNVNWVAPQAFGSRLVFMAQSLTLMRNEWEKLPSPKYNVEDLIKRFGLSSETKRYYINVRRDELSALLNEPNQVSQLSDSFSAMLISLPPPTLTFSPSNDDAKEFRNLADQGKLEELKQRYHFSLLNSQGPATGHTALHRAAGNGHLKIVKWLVETGADVGIKDAKKRTPRQLAHQLNQHEIAEFLKMEEGKQFRLAADKDDCEALEKYFSEDILNLQGIKTGHSALHRAAGQGNVKATTWLLEHHANIYVQDKEKKVPVELAIDRGKREVAKLFGPVIEQRIKDLKKKVGI